MYNFIKLFLILGFFSVPLCLGMLLAGLILLWVTRKQFAGKVLVTSGFCLLLFFSVPIVSNFFLGRLEHRYLPIATPGQNAEIIPKVNYVVVLAGGHTLDLRLPITSQFSEDGLVRLIEGIRLYKKLPGSKLLLSGGAGEDPMTDAQLMYGLCLELGVPDKDLILESLSKSTADEALLIKPIVNGEPFLLVTSARHMVRAIALFRKLGMNPIAAPTGHLVKQYYNAHSIIPNANGLVKSDQAMYEYLAIVKGYLWSDI